MKNNKLTITIGIPAYNEEANIYRLLKSIISQKVNNGVLEKIIIISDGSKDQTVNQAKKINDNRLLVVDHKKRRGAMVVQNEILEIANSNVLILLDADVVLDGKNFIDEIVEPILKDEKIGIVGADTVSMAGKNFIEKVIARSHEFKKNMYKRINNGDNIYLCHGRARAFSKDLYKNFEWPKECPEDAFSYLACIKNGFKFKYSLNAKIIFKSPSSLTDHKKQSHRFREGKKALLGYFNKNFVSSEYHIPRRVILRETLSSIEKFPLLTFSYFFIYSYLMLSSKDRDIDHSKIKPSKSSKKFPL